MSDCIFCKIVAKKIPASIVFEDEQIMVFKDLYPKARVHLLMIPKKHIENLATTQEHDTQLLGHMLFKIKEVAKQNELQGFKIAVHNGEEGGQEVMHLHLHILGT